MQYRQILNTIFIAMMTWMILGFFNKNPIQLPVAHKNEYHIIENAQRASINSKDISMSLSLKGLIIDDLHIQNHTILAQSNGTKLIPTWSGTHVPNLETEWSVLEQNENEIILSTMINEYEYIVQINVIDNKLRISQSGNKSFCKLITKKNNIERPIAKLDSKIYNSFDESKLFFKGKGWIASDGKYLSSIIKNDESSEIHFEKYQDDIFALSIENKDYLEFIPVKKTYKTLQEYKLTELIDFGNIMWFITKPSFYFINFLEKISNSFGMSIILFCILTRVIIMPVAWNAFRSMKKMSEIKPLMNKIQEQYKNDALQMRSELGKLFKEHRVNPMSSLFSMLIQLPVFFALFNVFPIAYGAYHSSFLWIQDLSEPNLILFIICAFSTALSFLSNDNQSGNQMMMILFPVIFIFFTYHLASGLILGILISNIVMFVQNRFFKMIYR